MNIDIRQKKDRVHREFDSLWGTQQERQACYQKLKSEIGTIPKKAHFANMNSHWELDRALRIIRRLKKKGWNPKARAKAMNKKSPEQIKIKELNKEIQKHERALKILRDKKEKIEDGEFTLNQEDLQEAIKKITEKNTNTQAQFSKLELLIIKIKSWMKKD